MECLYSLTMEWKNMKKYLAAFTLTLFALLTYNSVYAANSVDWHNYSPSVFQQAKSANRTVMLFAMSNTCHWCDQMKTSTFTDAAVVKMMNDNFYAVKLQADKDSVAATKFGLESVPTIIFFDVSGNMKKTYKGFVKADVMMQYLTEMKSG